MFSFVNIAYAADQTVESLVVKISVLFINPLIIFMFVLAFLYFLYGAYEYFIQNATDTGAQQKGKDHMIYGIIGLVIMMSVYGIINIILRTTGADRDIKASPDKIEINLSQ